MKPEIGVGRNSRRGYAILIALGFAAISALVFAIAAQWATHSAMLNDRNNVYNATVAAAEAATERPLSFILRDFLYQSYDPTQPDRYVSAVPTNDWAAAYEFSDRDNNFGLVSITSSTSMVNTNLQSQFAGLYGLVYTASIQANATPINTPYSLSAGVQQDFQLASIPVFQFAIFHAMDLELNPGAQMTVTGKVHGNANIYTAPVVGLEYKDDVGAVARIYHQRHPDDPTGGSKVAPDYRKQHTDYVSSLNLPVSTNNSPRAVQAILDPPPEGELAVSQLGQERYYNRSDVIITTTATNVIVQAGKWDFFSTNSPDLSPGTNVSGFSFVNTNATFYDGREKKWTLTTDIDVGKFGAWLTNGGSSLNGQAQVQLGHQLNSIFVNDTRAVAGRIAVVRVLNGRQLPPNGLTVATPRPLYVKGHFNAPDITVGSTNTAATKPSSLVGDAVTVLSGDWSDAASGTPMNAAANTTVNAAFLSGIVPTTNYFGTRHYSGGVENFPRLLENWTGKSLTYNGSMVIMFPSRYATNWWVQTGTYYNAPARRWAFDLNFLDYRKLPPATPQVRKLVRGQWQVVSARQP